jgi:hypothetical protein
MPRLLAPCSSPMVPPSLAFVSGSRNRISFRRIYLRKMFLKMIKIKNLHEREGSPCRGLLRDIRKGHIPHKMIAFSLLVPGQDIYSQDSGLNLGRLLTRYCLLCLLLENLGHSLKHRYIDCSGSPATSQLPIFSTWLNLTFLVLQFGLYRGTAFIRSARWDYSTNQIYFNGHMAGPCTIFFQQE